MQKIDIKVDLFDISMKAPSYYNFIIIDTSLYNKQKNSTASRIREQGGYKSNEGFMEKRDCRYAGAVDGLRSRRMHGQR